MDRDVEDKILEQSLQQFLNDIVVDKELEEKFWEDPKPDNGWLGLWMVSKILDRRCYLDSQELSDYRADFESTIHCENNQRKKKFFGNYKELDEFTDEQIEKFQWTFDIFLMEQASQYLEN